MTQAEANKAVENQREVATETGPKEEIKNISQDDLKSLLDENNKKIAESLEKQKKELEKLLKITREAKVEEVRAEEEERPQVDPFELYKWEKQNERDKFLVDQMHERTKIETVLARKEVHLYDAADKKLVAHHQEVSLINLLNKSIYQAENNSKSIYTPFKEQLIEFRKDMMEFNYVKIFMQAMETFKEHKKQVSPYIKDSEVDIQYRSKFLDYEDYYNDLIKRIYK